MADPYQQLLARAREIALYDSASALLAWDQQTYLPPQGVAHRAEQLGHFGARSHALFTAPEVDRWLSECEGAGLDRDAGVNVREWRRRHERSVRLPGELVEEVERAKVIGNAAWAEARQKSDFALFAPHLKKMFGLARQMADLWGYRESPYDALLEGYEPGARASQLAALFAELKPALVSLLGEIGEHPSSAPADVLARHYPIAAQEAFNREVAEAIGFDFSAGGINTTTHPFCERVGPGDTRLTTRYNERNFLVSLYGVLHEAGHGMYEQGLDQSAYGTPLGTHISLGIHESQSRLWENQVGRSRAFWERWLPRAAHHFPALCERTPEEMFAAANRVAPSFIRVEADQVTYDLHIMLRFDLEQRILSGEVAIRDVPAAWNDAFARSFGLHVPNDALGCLQDVHWSEALIGYFPTYTLGNLGAAQLFRRANVDRPELASELQAGRYGGLLDWLRTHVHSVGQRLPPADLIAAATGEPLRAEYHLQALREKFGVA